MSEPKPPIPLDYKTPDKVEPITARMVISRVISGFCGMFTLFVAFTFTGIAIRAVANLMSRFSLEGIVSALFVPLFALIVWIFTLVLFGHAIAGDRRPRRRPTNDNNPSS